MKKDPTKDSTGQAIAVDDWVVNAGSDAAYLGRVTSLGHNGVYVAWLPRGDIYWFRSRELRVLSAAQATWFRLTQGAAA